MVETALVKSAYRGTASSAGRRRAATAAGRTRPGDLDAAALTPSVAAMPDHAPSLRAFRQPAGGTAQLAGTSTTTTVSVVAAGPLTPGVTYDFWLVGHNSQGDGPESNHVTHAVPVGP